MLPCAAVGVAALSAGGAAHTRFRAGSVLRKHLQRHERAGKVQQTGFKRPYESFIHVLDYAERDLIRGVNTCASPFVPSPATPVRLFWLF